MSRVLVVGDVMLDEFIYGDVTRISPEAATPVLSATKTERMIGGAGNVARGVQALGTDCSLVGVLGDDRAGHDLTAALAEIDDPWIVVDPSRPTTHKTRFVSTQHSTHMLRVDRESKALLSADIENRVIEAAHRALADADVLVLSDYCKGVMTRNVAWGLIDAAKRAHKLVIVDSKQRDLDIFKHATIVKLNASELAHCYNATQKVIDIKFSHAEPDVESLSIAALSLARIYDIDHLIVTRGEAGMMLYSNYSSTPVEIPGKIVRVRDVSGAGDTVVATLAARLANKQDLIPALRVANNAAAIAVSKPGTAVVTAAELNSGGKIAECDWKLVQQRLAEWRGKRIGFTNGVFDLIHPGHLHLLTAARAQCDKLIVGINSDASTRRLKGNDRPVQPENVRAEMLAALDTVDLVVIFDDSTPKSLCKLIRPDIMFKGSDYKADDIAGKEFASAVRIIERIPGHSTTQTIAKANPILERERRMRERGETVEADKFVP